MTSINQFGNYEIFVPQGSKGKYNKYSNQIVVITSVTTNQKTHLIKAAKFYFTTEVDKIMGYPHFVKIGTSGTNVAIIPVEEDDGEVYSVTRHSDEHGNQVGMAFINVTAFAKFLNLEDGVYSAHKEPGGVVEFNRKSRPSKL